MPLYRIRDVKAWYSISAIEKIGPSEVAAALYGVFATFDGRIRFMVIEKGLKPSRGDSTL